MSEFSSLTPYVLPEVKAKMLPEPKGFKLLVMLPAMPETTEGGVFIPDAVRQAEQTASMVGFVVKCGSLAYGDPARFPDGPWCKEGDWVVFRSYSGTRIKVHGTELRIINDDTVEAVVDDPRGVQRV